MNNPQHNLGIEPVTAGEFLGWSTWLLGKEPFEAALGPFYLRDEPDGTTRCTVLPGARHCNSAGVMHGGFLMTFADFALFAIARSHLPGTGVTVSMSSDFLAPVLPNARIEATGEVVQSTKTLVFVRGLMTQHAKTVFMFSGIIKKLPRPMVPA